MASQERAERPGTGTALPIEAFSEDARWLDPEAFADRQGTGFLLVMAAAVSGSGSNSTRLLLDGVDEDPVTGAAHCSLAPYWISRLGRQPLVGYQASRRGGVVGVRTEGDRVFLAGHAVTVLRGELIA